MVSSDLLLGAINPIGNLRSKPEALEKAAAVIRPLAVEAVRNV